MLRASLRSAATVDERDPENLDYGILASVEETFCLTAETATRIDLFKARAYAYAKREHAIKRTHSSNIEYAYDTRILFWRTCIL